MRKLRVILVFRVVYVGVSVVLCSRWHVLCLCMIRIFENQKFQRYVHNSLKYSDITKYYVVELKSY